MIHALIDDRAHMVIRQRIVYDFSVAAVFDQLALLEQAKLMGDGGLGHV